MLTEVTCVLIVCDECGSPGFDSGDADDPGVFHFGTEQEAEDSARESQWFIGPDLAKCRRCMEKLACIAMGHDWYEWRDEGPHPFRGGIYVGRSRRCRRCWSAVEYDPPIPPHDVYAAYASGEDEG